MWGKRVMYRFHPVLRRFCYPRIQVQLMSNIGLAACHIHNGWRFLNYGKFHNSKTPVGFSVMDCYFLDWQWHCSVNSYLASSAGDLFFLHMTSTVEVTTSCATHGMLKGIRRQTETLVQKQVAKSSWCPNSSGKLEADVLECKYWSFDPNFLLIYHPWFIILKELSILELLKDTVKTRHLELSVLCHLRGSLVACWVS